MYYKQGESIAGDCFVIWRKKIVIDGSLNFGLSQDSNRLLAVETHVDENCSHLTKSNTSAPKRLTFCLGHQVSQLATSKY